MRWVTKREAIAFGFTADLTDEMFSKRDQIGIWYCGEKQYYVSETDGAAAMVEAYLEDKEALQQSESFSPPILTATRRTCGENDKHNVVLSQAR